MSEFFIHYVWQFQYFSKLDLKTTSGEPLHIFSPGMRNQDSGPDFLTARIRVGEMQWVGCVEIHIDASGWMQHKHNVDEAYENVILHVVWRNDKPVYRSDGSLLPTLEIGPRVEENLIFSYKRLINSVDLVPCSYALPQVKTLILNAALDKVGITRLESKARDVLTLLERNRGDWEETTYQLVARNFGFKVNAEPLFQLAQALSVKLLLKHADTPVQVEALLFGMAGFLDEDEEDGYYLILQREFSLLRQKYKLDGRMMKKVQWKFLRLRPANFPTLRLAQLAALIVLQKNLFSKCVHGEMVELKHVFANQPSVYWHTHYNFSRKSAGKDAIPGIASIDNVIINSVVPLLAAYSIFKDESVYMERAVLLLQQVPSEQNRITRTWASMSVKSRNAFDSQALIELYNNFCSRHRCLDCNIGASLMKPMRI